MRVLLITGRFPLPGGRGDQVRAALDVAYLSKAHELTVLAAESAPSDEAHEWLAERARVVVVSASRGGRLRAAVGAALAGQPGQCGWMMPRAAWRTARRLAAESDVVLVNTARCLRGRLPVPVVLDHVDSLSHNMRMRAEGPESRPLRLLLRFEAWRMASWERRAAVLAEVQVAASHEVRDLLPSDGPVAVLPNGWAGKIFPGSRRNKRDIDVIFTGNMGYPPNRQGAEWLVSEILPQVRAARPQTTAWIVGRDACGLAQAGVELPPDVEVASDVDDLLAFMRRARVAVAPVFGAGSPSKTIEAAASGAAVVSTPYGLECYGLPGEMAQDTESFAAAIVRLLDDEAARREQVTRLQSALRELTPERLGPKLESVLDAACNRAEREANGNGTRVREPGRVTPARVATARLPPARVPPGSPRRRPEGPISAARFTAAAIVVCAVALTIVLSKGGGSAAKGITPAAATHPVNGNAVINLPFPYPNGCLPEPWPALRADRVSEPPPVALDPARTYVMQLQTNCGAIEIALNVAGAPHATAMVANLVEHGVFDSTPFYRGAKGFLIQAGLRSLGVLRSIPSTLDRPGEGAYPPGTVLMFRTSNDPAGASRSDFFIITGRNHLPAQYAVLGRVTQGLAAVRRIAAIPTSPAADGQPRLPVVINRADITVRCGSGSTPVWYGGGWGSPRWSGTLRRSSRAG